MNVTSATLAAGRFVRGDALRVEITATDSYGAGEVTHSGVLKVPNGAPEILSDPSHASVGAGRYRYSIRAKDPDHDRPLRYALIEGPDAMDLDLLSGVLSWRVPRKAQGSYLVEIAVRDPMGAESRQRYTIELSWEESSPASSD